MSEIDQLQRETTRALAETDQIGAAIREISEKSKSTTVQADLEKMLAELNELTGKIDECGRRGLESYRRVKELGHGDAETDSLYAPIAKKLGLPPL